MLRNNIMLCTIYFRIKLLLHNVVGARNFDFQKAEVDLQNSASRSAHSEVQLSSEFP
jgi:hypothetical protein